MDKKTLNDVNVHQKRVLVRVDFNVSLSSDGSILDNFRIKAVLPTINYLRKNKAKVILMSHLGRPKGKVVSKLKMDPVAKELSNLLKVPVKKLNDCVGEKVSEAVTNANYGDVLLLENLRFHREESENDTEFAKKLASLADIYVDDAFATAHRIAASNVGITAFLPSIAGYLMEKEITVLTKVLTKPEQPFIAILGGAKVSDKINVISNLMNKVEEFLIGGGMCFTFLRSKGYKIGYSLCEEDKISIARKIIKDARKSGVRITLPLDVVVVPEVKNEAPANSVDIEEIPKDEVGVDIGPRSIKVFKEKISRANTIVWNGPLGVFEIENFAKGTYEIAEFLGTLQNKIIVAGGGETAAALRRFGIDKKVTHVSTGGGAFLRFLEGKSLPAIEAIEDKH